MSKKILSALLSVMIAGSGIFSAYVYAEESEETMNDDSPAQSEEETEEPAEEPLPEEHYEDYVIEERATAFDLIKIKRSIAEEDGKYTMDDYEYVRDFLLRYHDGKKRYAKKVIVDFDTQGYSFAGYSEPQVLDPVFAVPGLSIRIPQHTLEKENCNHGGWYYNGRNYRQGEEFVVPEEGATFTPYWFVYHVVTYLAGDYDDVIGQTMSTVQATEGLGFDLADSSRFSRKGYKIVGWECSDDGEIYGTSARYTVPENDVSFTAIWKPLTYEISITAANGNSSDKILSSGSTGEEFVFPECTFTNGEKEFAGWNYDGTVYQAGDTMEIPALLKGSRIVIAATWK